MDELSVERVLRAVESIPSGAAAPYSEVGRAAGASARFVARVLSRHGATVPWWRVPTVRGVLPPPLVARARPQWEDEGTPLTADGRIDLARARVDPEYFAAAVAAACADLPDDSSDPDDSGDPGDRGESDDSGDPGSSGGSAASPPVGPSHD